MNARSCLLGVLVSLALAMGFPGVASAQVAGEADGVTAARSHRGDLVLRFSTRAARVYRRIAGKRVIVGCAIVAPSFGGYSVASEAYSVVRVPRRRQTLRTYDLGRADYCFVRLRTRGKPMVAVAPVTEAGRTYLDELGTVALMSLVFVSDVDDVDHLPTTEQAVVMGHGVVVALDSPEGVPPRGKVGYWNDGSRAVVAAVTARARRLFVEIEGDVVRTNVLGYLEE